jgi:hypothetical protein
MKIIKTYESFVNEELFGLSKAEKEKKEKKDEKDEELRKEKYKADSEENQEIYSMFHKGDQKIDFKDFEKLNAGGIEDIEYEDSDKIIEKSPLTKKAKEANDRGKQITYKKSQDFRKKLIVTTKDGVKIYLINADHVRDEIDIDYTMGGHAYVYPNYIPEDEVWIDEEMNKEDQYSTIVHETTERNEMRNRHLDYSKAHDDASAAELKVRKKLEKERKVEGEKEYYLY